MGMIGTQTVVRRLRSRRPESIARRAKLRGQGWRYHFLQIQCDDGQKEVIATTSKKRCRKEEFRCGNTLRAQVCSRCTPTTRMIVDKLLDGSLSRHHAMILKRLRSHKVTSERHVPIAIIAA